MLGFSPVGDEAARDAGPHLLAVEIERFDAAGYDRLHLAVDAWVVVRVERIEWVREWRLEAEQGGEGGGEGRADRRRGRGDFVDRFLPAYRAYLRGCTATVRLGASPGRC